MGTVSYSHSIVTMAVSVAVCDTLSVKEWCDLENRVRVRSKSLEMALLNRIRVPIRVQLWRYLVSFASYSEKIANFFIPRLYLAPPQGVTPSEFREVF